MSEAHLVMSLKHVVPCKATVDPPNCANVGQIAQWCACLGAGPLWKTGFVSVLHLGTAGVQFSSRLTAAGGDVA